MNTWKYIRENGGYYLKYARERLDGVWEKEETQVIRSRRQQERRQLERNARITIPKTVNA